MYKLVMDRRHKNLTIPELHDYDGAMQYMLDLGITDLKQRNEIFMTYHLQMIHVNPDNPMFCAEIMQYMLSLLEGFKGFPVNLLYWLPDGIGGNYLLPTQEYNFPSLTNSTGAISVQNHIDLGPEYEVKVRARMRNIFMPFRWRYPSQTGGEFDEWTDDPNNPNVDPFTLKHGLPEIPLDDPVKYEQYKILYVMFHEIGHAIDMYHTMLSTTIELTTGSGTELVDDVAVYNISGFSGVFFSFSPEWTSVSEWEMMSKQSPPETALWSQILTDGLPVVDFYPMKGPATQNGLDPPVTVYGREHPMEDFAECFACYMLNREYFRKVFPKKFAAMETYLNSLEDFFRRKVSSK